MLNAAKNLSPVVLEKLAATKFPNSYIYENKHFIGQGAADANLRLTERGQLAVIEIAASDIAEGKQMSLEYFRTDYCIPIRVAEHWVAAKRRDFGALADLPIFERVVTFFMVAASHKGGTEEMPCAIPALPKRRFLRLAMHEPGMWP